MRDLADTIRRLQAFEAAGAGRALRARPADREEIRTVVAVAAPPVQRRDGLRRPDGSRRRELADRAAPRVSVGGALSRPALHAFLHGAREMKEQGAFTFVRDAAPSKDLKAAFARGAA